MVSAIGTGGNFVSATALLPAERVAQAAACT